MYYGMVTRLARLHGLTGQVAQLEPKRHHGTASSENTTDTMCLVLLQYAILGQADLYGLTAGLCCLPELCCAAGCFQRLART